MPNINNINNEINANNTERELQKMSDILKKNNDELKQLNTGVKGNLDVSKDVEKTQMALQKTSEKQLQVTEKSSKDSQKEQSKQTDLIKRQNQELVKQGKTTKDLALKSDDVIKEQFKSFSKEQKKVFKEHSKTKRERVKESLALENLDTVPQRLGSLLASQQDDASNQLTAFKSFLDKDNLKKMALNKARDMFLKTEFSKKFKIFDVARDEMEERDKKLKDEKVERLHQQKWAERLEELNEEKFKREQGILTAHDKDMKKLEEESTLIDEQKKLIKDSNDSAEERQRKLNIIQQREEIVEEGKLKANNLLVKRLEDTSEKYSEKSLGKLEESSKRETIGVVHGKDSKEYIEKSLMETDQKRSEDLQKLIESIKSGDTKTTGNQARLLAKTNKQVRGLETGDDSELISRTSKKVSGFEDVRDKELNSKKDLYDYSITGAEGTLGTRSMIGEMKDQLEEKNDIIIDAETDLQERRLEIKEEYKLLPEDLDELTEYEEERNEILLDSREDFNERKHELDVVATERAVALNEVEMDSEKKKHSNKKSILNAESWMEWKAGLWDKTKSIGEAVTTGAEATMEAFKGGMEIDPTGILATIKAVAAASFAALNVGTIAAQMIPPPLKFEKGGVLSGPSHLDGGISGSMGGRGIELEGGEAIINKKSTSMFGPLLSSINSIGGGGLIGDLFGGGASKNNDMLLTNMAKNINTIARNSSKSPVKVTTYRGGDKYASVQTPARNL